jgi:hypothetical protein
MIYAAHCLTGIIHEKCRCGILPHSRRKRQNATSTFRVYE